MNSNQELGKFLLDIVKILFAGGFLGILIQEDFVGKSVLFIGCIVSMLVLTFLGFYQIKKNEK